MNLITIERKISIQSNKLDKNITNHISEKILTELTDTCDQKYGYIINIDPKKINIIDNIISNSEPHVFFTVRFKARVFKPKVNDEYEGKVCVIFQHGVLVDVMNKIKVLIPVSKLDKYTFSDGIFKSKESTFCIQKNTSVVVKINMIKYEKQNFNCIGELRS
jgi:DNA-directed RNA polymerase subunit E'/Rpb7